MNFAPLILVIDDDASVRHSICRVLGLEGMRVAAARGVKDALDHIVQRTPDLVITDLCMAPLAGWDLIVHLQSNHSAIPIFVVTALPQPLAGEGLRDVAGYFQKPLDLNQLVAAIRRQLGRRRPEPCTSLAQPCDRQD